MPKVEYTQKIHRAKMLNIRQAINAKRESKYVEWKERLDVTQDADWCEVIKDIVAMANSGGGYILIGVRNNGTSSGWDPTPLLNLDPAKITDKMAKYTGEQFDSFEIQKALRKRRQIALLIVHSTTFPMIFIQDGKYTDNVHNKERIAFRKGALYVRHGAKSEPGNSKDLREIIDREVDRIRDVWLADIRKVTKAPIGSQLYVLPPGKSLPSLATEIPIRITDDTTVPAYPRMDPNFTHPYREKETIIAINQKLGGRKMINTHDFRCVRKIHKVDQVKPEFYYMPKYGSPQYSNNFVDWIVNQYKKDSLFFNKAREKCKTN